MASVTSSGQVAEMAKCSRASQTDVIFVAMDALVEWIYAEGLLAKSNATAMSYPCVFDLTFVFLSLLFLSFIPGFQIRN